MKKIILITALFALSACAFAQTFNNRVAFNKRVIFRGDTVYYSNGTDSLMMYMHNDTMRLKHTGSKWQFDPPLELSGVSIITKTVAEMQALVGSFDINVIYIISDPQSSFGTFRVLARDTSNLETCGSLLKDSVVFDACYNLANDEFTEMHDNLYNNHIYQQPAAGFTALANFPWNNDRYFGNTLTDCNLTITTVGSATMQGNFCYYAAITLDDNGCAGEISMFSTNAWGTISLTGAPSGGAPSELSASRIPYAGAITIINGGVLSNILINSSLGILVDAQTFNDKKIDAIESTFNQIRTIAGSGALDFDISGYNQSFAGQWLITAVAPRNITSFTNLIYTHNKTFRLDAGSSAITFVDDGVNVFMKGGVNAVLANEGDYVTFKFVGNVAYEVDRGIY